MYAELSSGINFTKKPKQNKIKEKKEIKKGIDSYSKKGYFSLQRQRDAFCVWLNTHWTLLLSLSLLLSLAGLLTCANHYV